MMQVNTNVLSVITVRARMRPSLSNVRSPRISTSRVLTLALTLRKCVLTAWSVWLRTCRHSHHLLATTLKRSPTWDETHSWTAPLASIAISVDTAANRASVLRVPTALTLTSCSRRLARVTRRITLAARTVLKAVGGISRALLDFTAKVQPTWPLAIKVSLIVVVSIAHN